MMKYNIFLYNMYYHTLNTFYIQAFRYSTLDLIGPDWIINWIQKKRWVIPRFSGSGPLGNKALRNPLTSLWPSMWGTPDPHDQS